MDEYKLMNAAFMRKYPSLLGRMLVNVKDTMPGGLQLQGTTTDGKLITVEMDESLTQPIQGWIEVIGRPKSATVFHCREIICFEQNENEPALDTDAHNQLINIFDIVREGELYKTQQE